MNYKSTAMQCDDCGHKFLTVLRVNQTYVKCPKCKSQNTDIDTERDLTKVSRNK